MKTGLLMFLTVWACSQASAQLKVGANPANINPSAILDIESTNKGLLLPRVALSSTTSFSPLSAHVAGMKVYNTAAAGDVTPGEYYNDGSKWVRIASTSDLKTVTAANGTRINATNGNVELGAPLNRVTAITTTATNTLAIEGLQTGSVTDRIIVADENGVLKQLKSTMPRFFYAPSIVMPTAADQISSLTPNVTHSGGVFTVNLYNNYVQQFGGPFSTGTSNSGRIASTSTRTIPVLPAAQLDYYVTFFDTTVFESVTLSDLGVLTYKIKSNADVTIGSFMNIVFGVKPD